MTLPFYQSAFCFLVSTRLTYILYCPNDSATYDRIPGTCRALYIYSPKDSRSTRGAVASNEASNGLLRRVQGLNAENHRNQNMLKHAKRIITDQDGEISSLLEQNDQLCSHIRENREHVKRIRRANELGIFKATPRSEGLTTPYQQTPVGLLQIEGSPGVVRFRPVNPEDSHAECLLLTYRNHDCH